jgi:UDP-N-acetylglucosamine 2-epimerase
MKVMTVVGTRPEIIRLSEVIKRLDSASGVSQILVHTGQNWNPKLKEVFFDDLDLRLPDENLGITPSSIGDFFGNMFPFMEKVLQRHQPDAFLVLGDTNSALSTIIAKRFHIPTYHMEAGNRCFDANVPEELNRRIVDHTADFNLAYTEHARRNLLSEGIHPRTTLVTGSPLNEVLMANLDKIHNSKILEELSLSENKYFLVSAHREENVDFPERLESLLKGLKALWESYQLPVLVSTHPRLEKSLKKLVGSNDVTGIKFHQPFGFHDYCKLQLSAKCVLSDSGTIAEESTILGFPAVTLRSSIERPEALDTGSIEMVDVNPIQIVDAVGRSVCREIRSTVPNEYEIENTSERVVNFILSTALRYHEWSGIRDNGNP